MIQFHGSVYWPTFLYSLLVVTCFYFFYIKNKDNELVYENTNNPLILLYIAAFVLLVGWRPPSGYYFGDSSTYAQVFNNFKSGLSVYDPNMKEWFFTWIMYSCSKIMDQPDCFLLIECLYVLPVVLACRNFVPNHYTLMFIFCMGAFSFFSYGTNGIRNGMACSLIILAMSLVNGDMKSKLLAAALAFIAYNTHRTTALPIVCILGSFFVKDTRYIMGFWIASIFISLVAGTAVESFFTGLGFDDRMTAYSSKNIDPSMFSSTGFRWDFLLYSSMPIILGYYVVFIRKVWDNNYLLLLNTYILCNSFWVMMIRAAYSNRFAYLSWFMYALVLAYPCLKLEIWEDQGKKTAYILLAQFAFLFYMCM